MALSYEEIVSKSRDYTLVSWDAQANWDPIPAVKAEGIYFWDAKGRKYIDWSSMLVNVNIGHGNKKVIKAIQDAAAQVTYVKPSITTEPRAVLGEMLHEIVPEFSKTLFTLGGGDANENAMKIARLMTGRQKILTRYRSFHGGTFGAMMAGGDPRRLANEPGVPWVVHFNDPYAYRSPLYRGRTRDEGDAALADEIEELIHIEGPQYIAAIMLEGVNGTSGVIQGGDVFWKRIQEMCDKYNILLIIDEVMSGFGRTGKWFGYQNYPFVKPDMITMAKGITSGYVPLGGVMVTPKVAAHFDKNILWCGLTYSAHSLACAAGIACLQVYKEEKLLENAARMGKVLEDGLKKLQEKHPVLGDIRGYGLLNVIELTKNRATHEPLSPFNGPLTEPMKKVSASLSKNGLSTFVRWNYIFNCPPLIVTEAQIKEGLDIVGEALKEADPYYEG